MAHGKYRYTTETKGTACTIKRVEDGKARVYDAAKLPPVILARLAGHGLLQKLTDQTNKETGDRLSAMDEIYKRLATGEWAAERVGGMPTVSAFIEAVARLAKGSIAEAQKAVGALDEATKTKLRHSKRVAEMTLQIEDERSKSKGLDVTALIG